MSTGGARPWPGDLEWGGDWLADAAAELAELGFVLRDGSLTGTSPGPRLLVALRAEPTLRHFDPEHVAHWQALEGHGRPVRVDRRTPLPLATDFAWGRIEVADRVPAWNRFLTFGGRLLVDAADDRTTIAAFVSRAPIVRWAGHSQGTDALADEVGAFFARLMVPIDFQAGAEERIAAAGAETLWSAFVHEAAARLRPGGRLRAADPELATRIDRERSRLAAEVPAAWSAGGELLASLELG